MRIFRCVVVVTFRSHCTFGESKKIKAEQEDSERWKLHILCPLLSTSHNVHAPIVHARQLRLACDWNKKTKTNVKRYICEIHTKALTCIRWRGLSTSSQNRKGLDQQRRNSNRGICRLWKTCETMKMEQLNNLWEINGSNVFSSHPIQPSIILNS